MIRLWCSDRDTPVKLDFVREFADRDAVKAVLNRLQTGGAPAGPAAAAGVSATGSPAAKVAPSKPVSAETFRWRKKLLSYADVRELHAKLVQQTAAVSDDDFWDAMRFKFLKTGERRPTANAPPAADASVGGRQGVPSDAFAEAGAPDADASTWEEGIPNPGQRHKVFMEFPAVARAHGALVPGKRTDKEFWKVFLETSIASKLTKGMRGRRSAASAGEADAVFAEFLTHERREAERETAARAARLSRAIDLDRFDDHRSPHVLEGHGGTGDAPRPMKSAAGRDLPASSSLRIMRQVNKHGRLILDGDVPRRDGRVQAWKRGAADRGAPLDDLIQAKVPRFAPLGAGAIRKAAPGEGPSAPVVYLPAAQMQELADGLQHWEADREKLMYPVGTAGGTLVELLGQMRPL